MIKNLVHCLGFKFSRSLFWRSFLLLTIFFLYIPLACFILLSFNEPSSKNTVSTIIGNWNGFHNYVSFFSDSEDHIHVLDALMNSLLIALISIPISLFIGLLTAISIWKNYGKGQKLVFLFCNGTIFCPDIIQAISFSLLFSSFFIPSGFFTVILTHISLQIPYVVISLYPKLSKLNLNLLLASYDLNFKFFESIINIICPALLPNLLGAAVLAFSISFDDYLITNLVRGNLNTISSEMYGMKTGVKLWAAVLGSLIIIFTVFTSFVVCLYKYRREKFRNV